MLSYFVSEAEAFTGAPTARKVGLLNISISVLIQMNIAFLSFLIFFYSFKKTKQTIVCMSFLRKVYFTTFVYIFI